MKVTVCQMDAAQLEQEWERLIAYASEQQPDLLLLPEMAFSEWFAASDDVQEEVWEDAVRQHLAWSHRLGELGVPIVAGTAPVNHQGKRHNTAFIWTGHGSTQFVHTKTYLPDEPGFWEASWYERGGIDFRRSVVGELNLGFMICTEMWFMQHAREYAEQGVHLLLCPRSTPISTNDKWLAGGRTAAVVSGAYCLSSNHYGHSQGTDLGGLGWVIDPDGVVLGTTSDTEPFITIDIDIAQAELAKNTYPRYVDDGEV